MKKIAIVNNGELPVPAVKGGAVECLIDLLLNENEKYGKFHFEVYSIYDKNAEDASKKYKYASFVYIDVDSVSAKLKYIWTRLINYVSLRTGGFYRSFALHSEMAKHIRGKQSDYLAILLEGASINTFYL